MGMTNEEKRKKIKVANILLDVIANLSVPMLMYDEEKEVTREALENYIKALEQQPILDKIRAEIEQRKKNSGGEPNRNLAFNVCLKIIDKYRTESEE